MNGPSAGWVEVLHALALGMSLRREAVGWAFGGSEQAKIDETVIADLIAKGLVVAKRRSLPPARLRCTQNSMPFWRELLRG